MGRDCPFAWPSVDACFLRTAAVHRYEFERQQRVDSVPSGGLGLASQVRLYVAGML